MSRRAETSSSSRVACGAMALAACGLTVQGFVPISQSISAVHNIPATNSASTLRGATAPSANPATDRFELPLRFVGAAAGIAIMWQLASSRAPRSNKKVFSEMHIKTGSRATLMARGGDEDAPPPPPPFDPSRQVGALPPLDFFDPAGFCKVGDKAAFNNFRAAELKHGRVAMMAALGAVVQHYVVFPGFDTVPRGLGAVTGFPGSAGFALLFAVSGALELQVWAQDPNKEPGNFGDPLGLGMYDDDTRNKEINNGRMAMFSILGILSAELLTGKDAIDQFGLGV